MSWAIWLTGPPGSGKSTLARLSAARLASVGAPVTVLELDRLRTVLTPQATYRDAERDLVYRALVFIATALVGAGQPVLIDATGHRRQWRDLARASVKHFAEVQLEHRRMPGVDLEYERARAPELVIDTERLAPDRAADRVADVALALERAAPARRARGGGAVIWLTGPPGSGKTTLAARVVSALTGEGVATALVEWDAVRATVLPSAGHGPAVLDLGHRTLALTVAELAAAGLAVVVDAAAPHRAWRDLGRALCRVFAEVQLHCPRDVCAERERVVRWRSHPGPHDAVVSGPEWPVEYEYALKPELIVDTAARCEWTAAEDVLRLARRLVSGRDTRGDVTMRVRDLMSTKPITVEPATPMLEARQRMLEERIRHLIVVDDGRVVGIITDRDIRLNLPSPATSLSVWEVNYLLAKLAVRDVMTRAVMMVDPERSAAEAARILLTHKISALPVTDGRQLVGIVTESDFVRVVAGVDKAA